MKDRNKCTIQPKIIIKPINSYQLIPIDLSKAQALKINPDDFANNFANELLLANMHKDNNLSYKKEDPNSYKEKIFENRNLLTNSYLELIAMADFIHEYNIIKQDEITKETIQLIKENNLYLPDEKLDVGNYTSYYISAKKVAYALEEFYKLKDEATAEKLINNQSIWHKILDVKILNIEYNLLVHIRKLNRFQLDPLTTYYHGENSDYSHKMDELYKRIKGRLKSYEVSNNSSEDSVNNILDVMLAFYNLGDSIWQLYDCASSCNSGDKNFQKKNLTQQTAILKKIDAYTIEMQNKLEILTKILHNQRTVKKNRIIDLNLQIDETFDLNFFTEKQVKSLQELIDSTIEAATMNIKNCYKFIDNFQI